MTTAYCIKGPNGEFYPLTVRLEPDVSIIAFQGMMLTPWKVLAAGGLKVVKVELREVGDEG